LKSLNASRIMDRAEYLITVQADNPQWQKWLDAINNSQEIIWEKFTKSGNKKQINLRDRLFSLALESEAKNNNTAVIRFTGSCRNDGTNLSSDNLIYMLEQIAKIEVQLLNVHRQQLILN